MAHPLKDYAKHVQRELEKDITLARPAYQWCLNQVIQVFDGVRQGRSHTDIKAALVEHIKPNARKAG